MSLEKDQIRFNYAGCEETGATQWCTAKQIETSKRKSDSIHSKEIASETAIEATEDVIREKIVSLEIQTVLD